MKSGRASNAVLSCANIRVELQEPLFDIAAELDASRILNIGRPIDSSLVSAIIPNTGCIKLTGTLRCGRGVVILAPCGYMIL